ncbi:Thioredoxin domain-containing protein 3 [Phlyctochytrium bullatum]|nr:Thioredoxin domain-containing protein 3 [Phlyctochytrium bullatum]
MSAHAKRVEVVTSTAVSSDEEFTAHILKPGIRAKFAGPCEPMTNVFKRLKLDYGDSVNFVQAQSDGISAFENFRNKSCPLFLFCYNGIPVKMVRGANAPLVERIIKEMVDLHKQGSSLPPLEITEDISSLNIGLQILRDREAKKEEAAAASKGRGDDDDEDDNPKDSVAGSSSHVHRDEAGHGEDGSGAGDDASVPQPLAAVSKALTTASLAALEQDAESAAERTLAIIKPDAMQPSIIEELLGTLHRHRINILRSKKIWLTQEQVAELYREHEGRDWFPKLQAYMSTGPIIAMELSRTNCIQIWRKIVGPRDPKEARAEHPKSLRAQYGVDSLMNSFHASDGEVSASRELEYIFGLSATPAAAATEQKPATEAAPAPAATEGAADGDPAAAPVAEGEGEAAKEATPAAPEGGDAPAAPAEPTATTEGGAATTEAHAEAAAAPPKPAVEFVELPFSVEAFSKGHSSSLSPQKTLAIIKPNLVDKVDDIIMRILARGYKVQKREEVILPTEKVQELYSGLQEAEPERFAETVAFLTSGPSICLVLKGEDVIAGWNELIGPEDPEEAKRLYPQSLRALYGTDAVRNGFHGSESIEKAVREIHHVFPHYLYSTASMSSLFDTRPPTTRNSTTAVNDAAATRSVRNSMAPANRGEHATASASAPSAKSQKERTLALIKPDAYPAKKEEIVSRILADGFRIVVHEEVRMSLEKAQEFYAEHVGKPFYETLTTWMSSAPIYALVLEKEDGIKAWRKLAGPTNSEKAREESPESIRALFGTDGSQNAVHGSDSPTSAAREIHVIFGERVSSTPGVIQQTLALIKPDAYPDHKAEIVEAIVADGFVIVKEEEVRFTKEKAEEFYKEHAGKGFYEELTSWMSSAPIYALVLQKEDGIAAWRALAGPTNSEKARESSPASVRARFGTDGSKNAVHGSDSPASAEREIKVVFGDSVAPIKASHSEPAAAGATHGSLERTLALIKPDAYPAKKDEILASIRGEGFLVLKEEEVHFTKEKAEEFYKEHTGKPFYEDLTTWMSSAAIYAMVLEKEGAISGWRALAGPTNSEKARESAPNSIRARFGTDGSQNAVHGSDSPASAEREIGVVFGSAWAPVQKTLALIKPDVYPAKKNDILEKIRKHGFEIVEEKEVRFSKEKAEEFYQEHKGKGFYEELTNWMSSAPIYAMVLQKPNAIKAWRELAGPTNSNTARENSSQSIRALFGTDGSQNAVHGSDSPASAEREIGVVFGSTTKAEVEDTLALIKPDAFPGHKDEILERITEAGFEIVKQAEVHFSKEKASEFYKEHDGKPFYETLTTWMSSAPIYAMVLRKENAIKAWRELAGPTNSEKARETSPNSIRALFGTDGSQNAVHGSDSPASATREIEVVFGGGEKAHGTVGVQKTLALIKPDAYPTHKDAIVARIKDAGFTIVKESEVTFSLEKAQEFYKEHVGKPFYEDLTTWMSSAPIYAIVLEKENGIKAWRELAGPTNAEKAREATPDSIRALFGTDGSKNAVHGSDSPLSAAREIDVVFGDSLGGDSHGAPKPPSATQSRTASRPESPNKARRTNTHTPAKGSAANTPKRSGSTASLKNNDQQPGVQPNTKSGSKPSSKPASKPASKAASRAISRAASVTGSAKNISRHPSRPTSALANPPIEGEAKPADGADVAAGAEAN